MNSRGLRRRREKPAGGFVRVSSCRSFPVGSNTPVADNHDEGAFLIFRPLVTIPSEADRASVAGRGCAQERSRPAHRIAA